MGILTDLGIYGDVGLWVLRFVVAIIFIYHGLPKIMKPGMFSQGLGYPGALVMVHGLVEVLASLGLIFGVLVSLSALLLGLIMIGAIYYKVFKWKVPFFAMDKTGWEFDFILLAANIAILLTGGGSIGIL